MIQWAVLKVLEIIQTEERMQIKIKIKKMRSESLYYGIRGKTSFIFHCCLNLYIWQVLDTCQLNFYHFDGLENMMTRLDKMFFVSVYIQSLC